MKFKWISQEQISGEAPPAYKYANKPLPEISFESRNSHIEMSLKFFTP